MSSLPSKQAARSGVDLSDVLEGEDGMMNVGGETNPLFIQLHSRLIDVCAGLDERLDSPQVSRPRRAPQRTGS